MKILDHTNSQSPTLMRDVYEHLIGKRVVIFTNYPSPLSGILRAYNGTVLHLTSDVGIPNTYIPSQQIIAISGDD